MLPSKVKVRILFPVNFGDCGVRFNFYHSQSDECPKDAITGKEEENWRRLLSPHTLERKGSNSLSGQVNFLRPVINDHSKSQVVNSSHRYTPRNVNIIWEKTTTRTNGQHIEPE